MLIPDTVLQKVSLVFTAFGIDEHGIGPGGENCIDLRHVTNSYPLDLKPCEIELLRLDERDWYYMKVRVELDRQPDGVMDVLRPQILECDRAYDMIPLHMRKVMEKFQPSGPVQDGEYSYEGIHFRMRDGIILDLIVEDKMVSGICFGQYETIVFYIPVTGKEFYDMIENDPDYG